MGLGTRFDPGVIGTPLSVVGGLLDELVGALAKSAKGCEGDGLEADVQVLLLNFATLTVTEHTGHNLGTVPQNYTNAELATHANVAM